MLGERGKELKMNYSLSGKEIPLYFQAKHPEYLPPVAFSARNMGKNDLWIAATAFLFGLTLVTTDHDFDHLHPDFIEVVKF
jgi:tRNA(fMet)-specific endonuclease VapC